MGHRVPTRPFHREPTTIQLNRVPLGVDRQVVVPAQQDQVIQRRSAAVGPVRDVVRADEAPAPARRPFRDGILATKWRLACDRASGPAAAGSRITRSSPTARDNQASAPLSRRARAPMGSALRTCLASGRRRAVASALSTHTGKVAASAAGPENETGRGNLTAARLCVLPVRRSAGPKGYIIWVIGRVEGPHGTRRVGRINGRGRRVAARAEHQAGDEDRWQEPWLHDLLLRLRRRPAGPQRPARRDRLARASLAPSRRPASLSDRHRPGRRSPRRARAGARGGSTASPEGRRGGCRARATARPGRARARRSAG